MENNSFINNVFSQMLDDYLDCKNSPMGIKYNSFNVVIIRLLTIIYDELDIVNPYYVNNEKTLYDNLTKFDYPREELEKFFELLVSFSEKENSKDFVLIQKMLIDMFMQKKVLMDLTEKEINDFRNLLYSSKSKSTLQISFNYSIVKNSDEVLNYFDKQNSEIHKFVEIKKPKEMLNLGAYEILKYSLEDIQNMDAETLENVNKEVYNYFEIDENTINKKYLLDQKVFDIRHPKQALSSGKGYVDFLLYASILATVIMVVIIFTLIII